MTQINDTELSTELQELYLQNKQFLSDIFYLEDEMRFFQKLFTRVLALGGDKRIGQEDTYIDASLSELEESRVQLKHLVLRHQHLVTSLLKDPGQPIGLELIEENAGIVRDITALLASDILIKKELFSLVEQMIPEPIGRP